MKSYLKFLPSLLISFSTVAMEMEIDEISSAAQILYNMHSLPYQNTMKNDEKHSHTKEISHLFAFSKDMEILAGKNNKDSYFISPTTDPHPSFFSGEQLTEIKDDMYRKKRTVLYNLEDEYNNLLSQIDATFSDFYPNTIELNFSFNDEDKMLYSSKFAHNLHTILNQFLVKIISIAKEHNQGANYKINYILMQVSAKERIRNAVNKMVEIGILDLPVPSTKHKGLELYWRKI